LPGPATPNDRPLLAMMDLKLFSASGMRIVLGIGEDCDRDGISDYADMTDKMRGILYDIPSGRTVDLGISATVVIPSIDSKGRGLLVVTASMENQEMVGKLIVRLSGKSETWTFSTWGLPGRVCPTADLLPMILPANLRENKKQRFILYDVKAGKKYASLAATAPFFGISGVQVHWTGDGRYLYYLDGKPEVPGRKSQIVDFTRIYDHIARKQLRTIEGLPVGPGPGDGSMVIAGRNKDGTYEVVLYDTATMKSWSLGGKSIRPIRANGKYLLYTKSSVNRKEDVYAAEIVMPHAGKSSLQE